MGAAKTKLWIAIAPRSPCRARPSSPVPAPNGRPLLGGQRSWWGLARAWYGVPTSWVEVRGLNGDNLYGAILQGQVLLPLGRGVKVLAGRPDLVRVSVAGERPKVLGRINRIEWVLFPFR